MINEIEKANILQKDSIAILRELTLELDHTFDSVQVHRTRTEMEVSVLNDLKHPTPASKYWQAVREQNAMLQGVILLSFDYRIELTRSKLLVNKIQTENHPLKRELLEIKLEKKQYNLKNMRRTATHKIREIKEWSEIKKREAALMSEEDLADVGNHQLMSYTKRWINQALEMGTQGSPSENSNLMGQLSSAINLCKEKGILSKVLEGYNDDVKRLCEGK